MTPTWFDGETISVDKSDSGSISGWIDALRNGDPEAPNVIWRLYFVRLVRLAERRLGSAPHQAVEDAEDAALSAFRVFYNGVDHGRFQQLRDRVDLWQLLTAITINKVLSQKQRHGRRKRIAVDAVARMPGASRVEDRREKNDDLGSPIRTLPDAFDKEPTPESAAVIEEQLQILLASLKDETLEQIAVWRMEGLSNAEIATRRGCTVRTIERKLERIRAIWAKKGLEP
jgi:DNA-directed RNA polymerase specialized sigma24 family protein